MAASGSSVWPVLSAGNRARASEVETKLDWLEQTIMPMNSGATTDLAYDLGGTITAHWRSLYTGSLNPTSTARGIAVGTTTVANNSSVALEIAGTRAMLMPRLSTVQRDLLTGVDGMILYNSTTAQMQKYQNGAWVNMGGSDIGIRAKVRTTSATQATSTMLAVAATGKLLSLTYQLSGANSEIILVMDSVSTSWTRGSGTGTALAQFLTLDTGDNTNTFMQTSTAGQVNLDFNGQLNVYVFGTTAATMSAALIYERT